MILLVTGIAFNQFGRSVGGVSLESFVPEIESFFARAGRTAAVRGKTVEVVYDPGERLFLIVEPGEELHGNREYLNEKYRHFRLPEGIGLADDRQMVFRCFPDGTAAGPEIRLTADGEVRSMRLSPLTGSFQVRQVQ